MKMYEYMGKEQFAKFGIPVPKGRVALVPEEASAITAEIGDSVIKSQILSGKGARPEELNSPLTPKYRRNLPQVSWEVSCGV
jgi:succinyl-CoA synthetase beta subunit